MSDLYPSGFRVGERIELIAEERKYNRQVNLTVGDTGTVVEQPNTDGWPDDAVQVRMDDGGCGALDACILKRRIDVEWNA